MRVNRLLALVVTALAALGCDSASDPSNTGGGGAGGDPTATTGGAIECLATSQCDDGNPCTDNSCIQGSCITEVAFGPTPPNYDDPTPNDCMRPICIDGALNEIVGSGDSCTMPGDIAGFCDAEANCSCANPDLSAPHYVDPVNGSDDVDHGGGTGSCAYKSLTYALTQARGKLHLVPRSYSASSGEILPFVLSEGQHVICDDVSDKRATLTGNGALQTFSAVIVMQGDQATVEGCTIEGTGAPTYCVDMQGDGQQLWSNDVSGCLNGVRASANGRVSNNQFHDNQFAGVFVQYAAALTISANSFENNGTDITCNGSSPMVGGMNNTGPNDTFASCDSCAGCPFE